MTKSTRAVKIATIATAIAFPLTLAACGGTSSSSGGSSSSTAPSAMPSMSSSAPMSPSMSPSESTSMSPSSSTNMMTKPFGAACTKVPKSGKGSFNGMSQDPVATAASNNPLLSTLVAAVKKAGLVDTLNNANDITVFAPSNSAFAKIDKKTLAKVLANKTMLTSILTEHVVPGRLGADKIAGPHPTLNKSQKVTVTGSGENFTVNGTAKVLCGNVQTSNATVYIIDSVLLPKS